jgi:cob(I)alamin adenosyltransferase
MVQVAWRPANDRGGLGSRKASQQTERSTGQISIYDGSGKGKSQAALGCVLRSIGLGIAEADQSNRVLLVRMLKGPNREYDEDLALEAIRQRLPHGIGVSGRRRNPDTIAFRGRSAAGEHPAVAFAAGSPPTLTTPKLTGDPDSNPSVPRS